MAVIDPRSPFPALDAAITDDDPRLIDARPPVPHGHDGGDLNSTVPTNRLPGASTTAYGIIRLQGDLAGTSAGPTVPRLDTGSHAKDVAAGVPGLDINARIAPARMPRVSNAIREGAATSFTTSDASLDSGNLLNIDANGNIEVRVPTNGVDFQQLRYHIVANGAARTVTFVAPIVPSTGVTLGPHSLARGEVLVALLEFIGNHQTPTGTAAPVWSLLAATKVT